MLFQSIPQPIQTPMTTTETRHFRIAVVAALALLFGSGQSSVAQSQSPSGCIGYCGNGIAIGIGIVAGAVAIVGILLVVNHDHHFLKGCVSNGPNGPQQNSEAGSVLWRFSNKGSSGRAPVTE